MRKNFLERSRNRGVRRQMMEKNGISTSFQQFGIQRHLADTSPTSYRQQCPHNIAVVRQLS